MIAIAANTLLGLARGRMPLVAAAFALTLLVMQSLSLHVEMRNIGEERALLQKAGYGIAESRDYLAALRRDAAATVSEDSLHYCALFLVFLGVFTVSGVFARETARGGIERLLTAPHSRASVMAALSGAALAFNQVCFTVLFAALHARLHFFDPLPFEDIIKMYALLSAVHVMVLSVSLAAHTMLRPSAAVFGSLAVVFLGFASHIVQIAAPQISGPMLKPALAVYALCIPRAGTLFYLALSIIRSDYARIAAPDSAWIAVEAVKTMLIMGIAFVLFKRKNY